MNSVRVRITINIIIIAAIAVGLVFVANDFFKETDMRANIELNPIPTVEVENQTVNKERNYILIYEKTSNLSQSIALAYQNVLDVIHVNYEFLPIESLGSRSYSEDDYIIFIVEKWRDYESVVDDVLTAAEDGSALILGYSPGNDTLFQSKMGDFGITALGGYRLCNSLVVKDDMLLGMHEGDILTHAITEDSIYEFGVSDEAHVYIVDENTVPLYYTIDYGDGRIGVYNGENTYERYYAGVIIGVLGTMQDGIIYPIINAGVVFIDDWPGPIRGENEIITSQYGMDLDGFFRYIWWPDMQELTSKYGVIYNGQLMLTYNDIQEPPFGLEEAALDVPMYSFGRQLMENKGEVGLHGYNHIPLWFSDYVTDEYDGYYEPWTSKEEAVEALSYALEQWQKVFPNYTLNCYVPPSNIIDETGIEVVKEVLGEHIVISGLYIGEPPQMPNFDFTIEDEVVYFPRLTAGSFLDDEVKLQLELGAGLFGVVSHFIHPDDVIDPNRSHGYTWDQLADEYDAMMGYITERYPFINFTTVTDAANSMMNWYNLEYSVAYETDGITVTTLNYEKPFAMILFSDQPIEQQGDGYLVQKLGDNQYYIEVESASVTIDYSRED